MRWDLQQNLFLGQWVCCGLLVPGLPKPHILCGWGCSHMRGSFRMGVLRVCFHCCLDVSQNSVTLQPRALVALLPRLESMVNEVQCWDRFKLVLVMCELCLSPGQQIYRPCPPLFLQSSRGCEMALVRMGWAAPLPVSCPFQRMIIVCKSLALIVRLRAHLCLLQLKRPLSH